MSELASIIDGEQWLCDRMLANLRAELSAGTLTDNGVPIVRADLHGFEAFQYMTSKIKYVHIPQLDWDATDG